MRVGIYCDDFDPELGGANSLTKTIMDEIESKSELEEVEFIYLYSAQKRKKKQKNARFQSINISSEINTIYRIFREFDRRTGLNRMKRIYDIIAEKYHIDLIWFCHPVFADISIPYIYTVWDLGHRTVPFFPEVSKGRIWEGRERLFSRMILNASWVLIGNETGKKEIIDNYNVAEQRIVIAPFPVSKFCKGPEKKPKFEMPEQYFFYPAQFWPHKNHIVILYALKYLADSKKYYPKVYFTGSDKGNKKYIEEKVKELGLEKQVVFTGFLSDEELKYMYTHATAMIFASLMGPNNMPPIEAAYLDCPIILSNLEGHIEQMGDAAMYFDATNEVELAKCMEEMMREEVRSLYKVILINHAKELEGIEYIKPVNDILKQFKKYKRCWSNE